MITNEVTGLREKRGVSKAHLARRIGVSRSYVTRLEQGKLQPSGDVMFRIARYFGCEVGVIFHWVEDGRHVACGLGAGRLSRIQPNELSACPAGAEAKDKSLVFPTAKAVAPLLAW